MRLRSPTEEELVAFGHVLAVCESYQLDSVDALLGAAEGITMQMEARAQGRALSALYAVELLPRIARRRAELGLPPSPVKARA